MARRIGENPSPEEGSPVREPHHRLTQDRLTLVLMLVLASCAEPFPSYQEPQSVLQAHLSVTVIDTIEAVRDSETGQWYLVSSPFVFTVTVSNTHDDLLAGEAQIEGSIFVTAFTQTPKGFSLELVLGNLVAPQVVDGEIALAPGEEALLRAFAHPILADGTLLIEGEPGGPIYGPISCLASGSMRIFGRIQPIQIPQTDFSVVFKETR